MEQNHAETIHALETKLAWLERFVNQLNDVIIEQEKRLSQMQSRVLKLENNEGAE